MQNKMSFFLSLTKCNQICNFYSFVHEIFMSVCCVCVCVTVRLSQLTITTEFIINNNGEIGWKSVKIIDFVRNEFVLMKYLGFVCVSMIMLIRVDHSILLALNVSFTVYFCFIPEIWKITTKKTKEKKTVLSLT